MRKNCLIHLWLILTLLVGQANCSVLEQSKKVKFDEIFTLRPGEAVMTEDAKLKIQLKGVGRAIYADGEVEYVELLVRINKSERLITIKERGESEAAVEDYLIKLINAESFGETHSRLKISRKL